MVKYTKGDFIEKKMREEHVEEECDYTGDDLFYSKSNVEFLLRGMAQLKAGKGVVHELLDDEDDED